MSFLELAHARYSCRSFASDPVSDAQIDAILEAARIAPTAKNVQPVRVWTFTSDEALVKIDEVTPCRYGAPVVFAIGGNKSEAYVREADGLSYETIDASIVETHMMLEAADLGLGSVWVGLFDPQALSEAFPEMREYSIVGLLPVGHPAPNAKPAPRHEKYRDDADLFAPRL